MASPPMSSFSWGNPVSSSPQITSATDRARFTAGVNVLLAHTQLGDTPGTTEDPATLYTVPTGNTIILKSIHMRNVDTMNAHQFWVRLVLAGADNDDTAEFHSVMLAAGAEDTWDTEQVLLSGEGIVCYADANACINCFINGLNTVSQ